MRVDPRAYQDRREVPKYRINEVALYLGINEPTLRNWFFGYHRTVNGVRKLHAPIIRPALHNPYEPSLSFYNLAEAQVLAATRRKWSIVRNAGVSTGPTNPKFGERPRETVDVQISMQAIRQAVEYVSRDHPVHPLISQYFFTNGKNLFIKLLEEKFGGRHLTVNVSKFGQQAFSEILDVYLDRIERDPSGSAIKVYPLRRLGDQQDKSIVIIPSVGSGRPTISGTGIRVEAIWNRSQAGENVEDLADDYGIEPGAIEKAISYFTDVKAA